MIEEEIIEPPQEQQPDPTQGTKLSVQDFAKRIKTKYPEYKDIDDSVLTQKMIAKYPEYKDSVDLATSKKKVLSSDVATPSDNGLSGTPKAKDPLQEALDARSRQRKEGAVGDISMPRNASDETATKLDKDVEAFDRLVVKRESKESKKYNNELVRQQALETTATRRLKAKGKPADEKTITEEKAAVQKDIDEGNLVLSSDGQGNKIFARQPGAGEAFVRGLVSAKRGLADAAGIAALKLTGTDEELANYYEMISRRKKVESEKEFGLADLSTGLPIGTEFKDSFTPTNDLPTAAPTTLGSLTEMAGGLLPDATLAAATGGMSVAAKTAILGSKMYASSYGNKAPELYEMGKQELMKDGMDEKEASILAAQAATKNAATAAIPDAAMNTLFFSGKLHSPAANNFISVMKGAVKDAVKVGALGAATSATTSAIEDSQGYDIDGITKKMFEAGGEFAKLDLLFKVLPILRTLPKAAQSAVKEFAVDPVVKPVVENYLKTVPEDIANRIRVELQDYKSATEPIRGVVPEEKMASLGGRMQKRQNRINGINIIKGDIEALEAKKKDLPETLHEEINTTIKERESQIKELEKEIESVDKEIGEINKSKETGLEKEIDEATGEPLIPKGEPEQISQPIELSTEVGELKPGDAAAEKPLVTVEPPMQVPEPTTIKVENEAATEKPIEPVEPIKAEEVITPKETVIEVSEGGGEPPKGEAVSNGIYSEPKRTEFSHSGLQEVATEFGLDPVTSRERVSDAQLFRRVDETLTKWQEEGSYDKNIKELMKRGEEKKPISDEENVIMAQHIAQLREQGKNVRKEFGVNSKEYDVKLAEINDAVRVGEAIRSQQGAALRVPIFSREYMPTLEDAMTAKMDAVGTDVLTPKQKVEVEKQFEKIEKERDEYKAKLEAANAKFAEMQAQNELSKPASKGKTTTGKRDYKAERQSLKDRLKEEVAAYKAAGQKMGIASNGGAESFVVSAKIAKTITEIAKTHVAEAGAKIKEVVERTLEDVKEYFGDNITDRDIMDVLRGKYNEKRKTRSQLAADMREVQTEAALLNEYQRLIEGGEPKNEKRQIQRNKRLAEIRKEVKGLEELDKEIQSSKDAELQVRIDKNKDTVDKLDKLEKEDAKAAEKKRKELEAENLKELAKLKEEFDKKVRDNERKKKEDEIALNKKLKEQADEKQRQMDKEAREYEKQLREEEIQRKKDEIALVKELDRKLKYKSPAERAAAKAIEINKAREKKIREKITNKEYEPNPKPETFWEEPSFKRNHPDLYKQVLDSYNKKEEAQLDYELELLKDAEGKKTKTQKVLDWLGRGANTTKKVVTGIDDSSLFMQTLAAMTARPFVAGQAIRLHALDAVSKKRFDRNLAELHNSPDYPLMQKSGLDITEPKSLSATAHEEAFSGKSWDITFKKGGKEYKVLQTLLSPFERAFTSLGNAMRVIAFRSLAEKFEREGHTFENNPQLYKDLATMLNTETGRGKQNELIERASNLITKGIWSPKLMASRLNMLGISDAISFIPGMDKAGTKGYYRQLTPEIRKQALKDLAKFSATVMAVSSLVAYALGGKVDNDPDSVTYLDIQTPDGKSYNISGGFAQYIKLVAQTISGGKRKNGILEEFKGEKSEGSNIMRFGRGKLTPLAGVITDFATGKDFMGKEVVPMEEAKKLAIPLSLQSVATEIKRDGLSSLFTATLPSFVGIQVKDSRDFENKKKETFTIYDKSSSKKRESTEEEYKKYEEDAAKKTEERLTKIKAKGVGFNRYGEMTIDENDIVKRKKYDDLTEEEKKKIESRVKSSESSKVKSSFKFK